MSSGWSGWPAAARWCCVALGAFLAVRAVSTLAVGASWALPGDGWRSLWQLAMAAVLAVGVARASAAPAAVALVGAVYAAATVLELFNGVELLGAIPVDMRDRVVHPLVAIVAAVCVLIARRRPVTVA